MPSTLEATPSIRPRAMLAYVGAAALGVLLFRLWLCLQSPHNSGDVVRHLYTALAFRDDGWRALREPLTSLWPASDSVVPWGNVAYNYPVGALAFFSSVAWLWPSVLAVKLVLTLVEAVNSWLVFRLSRSALLGLVYWASPLSLWWVSREGQFEPVQTLFVLLAVCVLSRSTVFAFALLAAAIQVKLLAVLLVPFFCVRLGTAWREKLTPAFAGLALGSLPTVLAMIHYPVVQQTLATGAWPVRFNPYHFFGPTEAYRWWLPVSFVVVVQLAVAAFIAASLCAIWRWRNQRELAALGFAGVGLGVLAKCVGVFQGWYWLVASNVLALARPARLAAVAFAVLVALEPLSLLQLFRGPVGPAGFPAGIGLNERLVFRQLPQAHRSAP